MGRKIGSHNKHKKEKPTKEKRKGGDPVKDHSTKNKNKIK